MRAQAELLETSERLADAARRGLDPEATQARLAALKLSVGEIIDDVEAGLPALAEGGPGFAGRAARHLVAGGGKRVRPLIVILAARAAGASASCAATHQRVMKLAQAAELTHAATLLHDDVLDEGLTRRGQPAARVLWGNCASVLGGDFLLIRALELAVASGVAGALDDLLHAIGRMIDGEALQLTHRGKSDLSPAAYLAVVDGKTASLFAWCGKMGARIGASDDRVAGALGAFGLHLGRAFQIVDDLLDIEGDPKALGKSVLSDVREGKLTLPVLLALEEDPSLRHSLDACLAQDADDAGDVAARIARTSAAARARDRAQEETAAAIAALAPLEKPPAEALRLIAQELAARVS